MTITPQVAVEFKQLLHRSHEFDEALRSAILDTGIPPSARSNSAIAHCKIAIEHGYGIRLLFNEDIESSGLALVRLQFEAVLRAMWLSWAASDSWLSEFTQPVEDNMRKEPVKFPEVYKMLDALDASESAPELMVSFMRLLKDRAWDAFNSYTHGGLRQMIRALNGYEPELLDHMVRTSNGLQYYAVQLMVHAGQVHHLHARVDDIRRAFLDCQHPLPQEAP